MNVDELVDRGARILGRRWRWLRPLARRLVQTCSGAVRPRKAAIEHSILLDHGFRRACAEYELHLRFDNFDRPVMRPIEAAQKWKCQSPLRTVAELADWLGLSIRELEWFADQRRLERRHQREQLRHYRYRVLPRRSREFRIIESPKPRLRAVQRQILNGILNDVPVHAAAHGFRRGHSIMTFARPHVARDVVIKLDLREFFPSIPLARVQAIFRSIGYPETVADFLAGLCTNSTPNALWRDLPNGSDDSGIYHTVRLYSQAHLPQGAPTSPAIANLAAWRMDCRLAGLARAATAEYTRYADDLAFSGDGEFLRAAKRFQISACAIAMDEGFLVNHRKTRIMKKGVRQKIAGVVVNQRLNVPRDTFDQLKATLTNCVRHGPESQNREGHEHFRLQLEGKVSFVESINPDKGVRLRRLLHQIPWPAEPSR